MADLRDAARRAETAPARGVTRSARRGGEKGAGALIDYLKSLAQTMMAAHDRLYIEQADYARTIPIATLGVGTTEFDIKRDRALALYESGAETAEKFLETWDFDAYLREFRSGGSTRGGRRWSPRWRRSRSASPRVTS